MNWQWHSRGWSLESNPQPFDHWCYTFSLFFSHFHHLLCGGGQFDGVSGDGVIDTWHMFWSLTDISHVYKYYEHFTILRYEAETHLNTWQYIYSNISEEATSKYKWPRCVFDDISHTHTLVHLSRGYMKLSDFFFFFQNFVNRQFDMGFYKRSILVAARFCCVSIHVSQTQIHQQAFVWPFERQWRTQKCSLI